MPLIVFKVFLFFVFVFFVCLFRHGNWQSIPSLILKGILQDAITLHRIQIIFILLYYIGIFKAIVNKLFFFFLNLTLLSLEIYKKTIKTINSFLTPSGWLSDS